MKKLLGSLGVCLLLLCFAFSARAEVITDWSAWVNSGVTKWVNEQGEVGTPRGGSYAGLNSTSGGYVSFDYMNGVPTASSMDVVYNLSWGRQGVGYVYKYIWPSTTYIDYYSTGAPMQDGFRYPVELSLLTRLSLSYGPRGQYQLPASYANIFDFNYLMGPGGETGINADLFVLRNPENMVTRFEFEGNWYEYSYENLFTELTGTYAEWARSQLALDSGAALYGLQFTHDANRASRVDLYPIVRLAEDTPPVPTPEPSSLLLMGLGLLGSILLLRRGNAGK